MIRVSGRPLPTLPYWALLVLVLGVSLAAVWVLTARITSVNPVDFLVYRYAASAAVTGADIYAANIQGAMMPTGGLPFVYTPFAALALLPTALFDSTSAFILWSLLTLLVLGGVIQRCFPLSIHRSWKTLIALGLSSFTIIIASHVIFGQINVFLMALCLADCVRRPDGWLAKYVPAGILIGLAAAIKLTPVLFIVHLAVTKQWRSVGWSLGALGSATVLAGFLLPQPSWTFFTETVWNLSDRIDLSGLYATSGNNSVQGFAAYLGIAAPIGAISALAVGALGLKAARDAYHRHGALSPAIIIGLTACLVSPVSWLHHWVYLIPAFVVLISRRGRAARWFVVASTVVLLATGPNLGDLLLATEFIALWPIGLILRESLILMGVVAIVFLWRTDGARRPPQPTRVRRGAAA